MNVVLAAGQLPAGYCWTGPQQYLLDIVAAITATIPGSFSGINFGPTIPSSIDQDKPWLRLNPDGTMDRWYVFSGQWISPHPIPPSGKQCIIWKDTEQNLWAYDGGDGKDPASNAPTAVSGAMWVRDTDFGADDGSIPFRFPVGIGKNGTTGYDGNAPTQIQIGDTPGGEERHQIIESEMFQHTHLTNTNGPGATKYGSDFNSVVYSPGAISGPEGGSLSHNNMPPYFPVIFARRSARTHFTLSP